MATTESIHAGSPTYDALSAQYSEDRMPAADAKRFIEQHGNRVRIKNGASVLYITDSTGEVEYLGASHGYVDISDMLDVLGY